MANCNSSRNNTNAAVTTATTCNEAGESILKSVTKGNDIRPGRTIRVNGERHNVLATVSIDTSKMENQTILIHLSGYIKGTKELQKMPPEDDKPMLFLVKKTGCEDCNRKNDCDDDNNEILADYTIPLDKFYDPSPWIAGGREAFTWTPEDYDYRVEHIFSHQYTDAVGASTCVSSVCSKDREGVATYYLTFKDADEYENKIKPMFEDVSLSALAVENKID